MRANTVFSVVWLTVVWVLLWGTFSWMNLVGGLLIATIVLWVFPLPTLPGLPSVRPVAFVVLAARFALDLVAASVTVAWQALNPVRRPEPGGLLQVQLRSRNPWQQTLTAELTALVPGTVVIDLDSESGVLSLHALGVHTRAEALAARDKVLAQEQRVMAALPARQRQPEPVEEG